LLKRDAESNRNLYDNLLQQMKEATIAAALNSSNIEVIDAARVPLSPSRPNVPRNVAFGILLGLAMGVASAFVAEMLDMTVRTPEQAEMSATLPVLGIIPLAGIDRGLVAYGARRRRMLRARPELPAETDADSVTATAVMNDPQSAFAESYRALRTSILLSSSAAPPKTILVTSALPKEGKTVTSVNIAISLAQQGRRVLLIDADLRRPSIHRRLRASNIIGLSNVLAGDANVSAAIQPSQILPSLFVVTAGPLPPYPSELLGSIGMRNHLAQLASEYDHVIIDSPPVLSVTDAVIMSVAVNKVVLVIRSGSTTKMALKRTRDLLAQVGADIMGVVMNAARLDSAEYSYGYYYGSRGAYSYASDTDELRRANA
jgi:polysaccharide biosynthesis transport protein